MKKKKIIYEYKASTNDYYVALSHFPQFTKLINLSDRPYHKLLSFLLEKENLIENDNMSFPSIKELSEQLGIDRSKISKYLKQAYEDIIELNWKQPNLFKKESEILCCLSFKYFDTYQSFYTGLNAIPRIGEHIDFYFVKAKLGRSGFQVKKVYHDIDHNGQSIMISLSAELTNNYLDLLREKAYLNHEISLMEFLDNEISHELKETLIKQNRNL